MPRRKQPLIELLRQQVSKHKFLTIEGDTLFCTTCAQNISFNREHLASRVASHVSSRFHTEQHEKRRESGLSQRTLSEVVQVSAYKECKHREFCQEITDALVSANIPIHKLESPKLATFLKKWTGQSIPSGNTLRYREISSLYSETVASIRKLVACNSVCMMLDETTDRCERFQVDVLVSVLNGSRSKPMLLHVEFAERCDAAAIFRIFIKACNILWQSEDPPYERVKLMVKLYI